MKTRHGTKARIRDGKLGFDCAESRKIFTPSTAAVKHISVKSEKLNQDMERREALIAEAMGLSANEAEIAKDES
jgi:hypothetical protein